MNQDFILSEKNLGSFIIPVTIEDLYVTEFIFIIIIFYSFPYDEGARRNQCRVGADCGPEQIKQALRDVQIYDESIKQDLILLDLGEVPKELPIEKAYEHLYQWVGEAYNQLPQSVLIILGGSQDQSYFNFKGLYDGTQSQKVGIVNIDQKFDVTPGEHHSQNSMKFILEDERQAILVEYGACGSVNSFQDEKYLINKGVEIFYMERDIRRKQIQLNQVFDNLKEVDQIFISFDVGSINSAWCLGVSDPCVVGGFNFNEFQEMAYLMGLNKKVKQLDISEFNPAVESTRTQLVLAEIIYSFILGFRARIK